MITVNPRLIANKSDETQYFNATAVVSEVTTAEWTEGIPQLPRAFFISNFPDAYIDENHLITTANKNAIDGIDIKFE